MFQSGSGWQLWSVISARCRSFDALNSRIWPRRSLQCSRFPRRGVEFDRRQYHAAREAWPSLHGGHAPCARGDPMHCDDRPPKAGRGSQTHPPSPQAWLVLTIVKSAKRCIAKQVKRLTRFEADDQSQAIQWLKHSPEATKHGSTQNRKKLTGEIRSTTESYAEKSAPYLERTR